MNFQIFKKIKNNLIYAKTTHLVQYYIFYPPLLPPTISRKQEMVGNLINTTEK
jgi:hypothetical protein